MLSILLLSFIASVGNRCRKVGQGKQVNRQVGKVVYNFIKIVYMHLVWFQSSMDSLDKKEKIVVGLTY